MLSLVNGLSPNFLHKVQFFLSSCVFWSVELIFNDSNYLLKYFFTCKKNRSGVLIITSRSDVKKCYVKLFFYFSWSFMLVALIWNGLPHLTNMRCMTSSSCMNWNKIFISSSSRLLGTRNGIKTQK